jgi:hypothetical protein
MTDSQLYARENYWGPSWKSFLILASLRKAEQIDKNWKTLSMTQGI